MSLKLLLLTIADNTIENSMIESQLDRAKDWLRYSSGCWLILTSQAAKIWYKRLSSVRGMDESLAFICEVNAANKFGKLSPQAWKWLKEAQSKIEVESEEARNEWARPATDVNDLLKMKN